jgi:outer membrane protein assembly factor BamB
MAGTESSSSTTPRLRTLAPRGVAIGVVLVISAAALLTIPSVVPPGWLGGPGAIQLRSPPGAVAPVVDSSDWPMYMATVSHVGVEVGESALSAATAPNLVPLWNYSTGGRIVEQPIVVGASVYVGSWDGNEYAVNVRDGTVEWRTFVGTTGGCGFPAPRGPSSTAQYLDGTLYFSGGDGYFYALNAADGSLAWRTFLMNNAPSVGFYGWSSAAVLNGTAYVGLSSGCSNPNVVGGIVGIRLTSHAISERLTTAAPGTLGADVWGTPTWDALTNSVYVSTGNGPNNNPLDEAVLQLDPGTLAIRSNWTVPPALRVPDGDFGTTPVPVVTDQGVPLIVAANKDGILFAFNRTNLTRGPLWETRVASGPTYSSAAFAAGRIFVGSTPTNTQGPSVNGSVRAIRPENGSVLWRTPFPGGVYGSISYANGLVAAAGGNELALMNASTGAVVWSFRSNTAFQGSPSLAHGMLFVGGVDGKLYAFGLPPPPTGVGAHVLPSHSVPVGWESHLAARRLGVVG